MTGVGDTRTFTVFIPFEDVSQDDDIVARNLSGADAIKIALEITRTQYPTRPVATGFFLS